MPAELTNPQEQEMKINTPESMGAELELSSSEDLEKFGETAAQDIDDKANEALNGGQKSFENANRSIGLSESETEIVAQETGAEAQLESVQEEIARLSNETKKEITAAAGTKNQEALEQPKSLGVENQKTFDEIMHGYKNLVDGIDARLKDSETTPEEKKTLVRQKKDHQDKVREIQTAHPEFAMAGIKEQQQVKVQELIARIPDESARKNFNELFQNIPEVIGLKYMKILEGILGNKDEVAVRTTVRGLLFELSRIDAVSRQGLEQIDYNLEITEEVEYLGFAKNSKDLNYEPNQKLKSPIELDIPIARKGEPYVYEAKSYPRMQYGSLASQRNQLLKYQSAVEQGIVEGATVEIKGRIDPDFLKWATGTNIADAGRIPDVEIIYTFELPSGTEHRFVLKRSRKNNGLDFQNEGRANTPEATLRSIKDSKLEQYEELMRKFGSEEEALSKLDEDRKIINGIQKSVLDRSIIDIITGVNIENPPSELQPYLENPMTIKSADLFDQYESLKRESVYKKLLAKREIINVDNKRSANSEFASRDYVEKSMREYQDYLKQNPEMAKIKKAYILDSEEDVLAAIEKTMAAIEKVKSFESERKQQEDALDNQDREKRSKMGYSGLDEGVALDIEHIIIDAIHDVNKKKGKTGRSYENPERFKNVEMLGQYLSDQDRRYLEIAIYDPLSEKTERNIDVNETHIKRTSVELLKENIKRAEERVQQTIARFAELNQKPDKTAEELDEIKFLSARLRAKEMQGRNIEKLKQRIEALKSEKVEQVKAEKDNAKKKIIASEYDDQIVQSTDGLASLYKEVLGGEKEWDKMAKRISEKIDQNMIKFIYAVKSDGEIVVGEEIIRGDVSGRAAHSELAQGRNVYGAGELAFTKDKNGQWTLSEINNGSGHYRPSALTLRFVKNLIQSKGIDVSTVELRDTLLRGALIPDLTMLEE